MSIALVLLAIYAFASVILPLVMAAFAIRLVSEQLRSRVRTEFIDIGAMTDNLRSELHDEAAKGYGKNIREIALFLVVFHIAALGLMLVVGVFSSLTLAQTIMMTTAGPFLSTVNGGIAVWALQNAEHGLNQMIEDEIQIAT